MLKHYLKLLALPITLLLIVLALNLTWELFDLPSPIELKNIIEYWFNLYGFPIIFLSSLVEGMLLVGGYFPGTFVIFLGVILAQSVKQAALVVLVVSLGLMVAHVFNYFLGKYGWYTLLVKFGLKGAIEEAQGKLSKRGPIAIFASYWMPNLAALTDTAAGILRISFKTFINYSVVATIFWNTLAGIGVYFVGDRALAIVVPGSGRTGILIFGVALWAVLIIIADYLERKYGSEEAAKSNDVL